LSEEAGVRTSRTKNWPTLAALIAGLVLGALTSRSLLPGGAVLVPVAETVGGVWVDALRMTIVPLIVSLVVTSIGESGGEDGLGRVSLRALGLFVALLALASLICGLVIPPFFVAEHGDAAARAVAGLAPLTTEPVPPVGEWVRALVPANVVEAAANNRIVPLVLFAALFGAALRQIDPAKRAVVVRFFAAFRDAILGIVGWILWLAPVGVFALIFAAAAGDIGGLFSIGWRYVAAQLAACLALIAALVVLVALFRRRAGAFVRAAAEPAMLALASRSSIACLPAMIVAADKMGLDRERSDTVLSLAVSLFKVSAAVTGFSLMAAMAAFDGHLLNGGQLVTVGLYSMIATLVIVGLPGQVSFLASTLPLASAIGVPLTALPLLLALDSFADMARTVTNVVGDLAVAVLAEPREEARA
jgi:Na+/H+-dicarboxylate symporter